MVVRQRTDQGQDDDGSREETSRSNLETESERDIQNREDEEHTPAMARPTIKVTEEGATAEIKLPTSKMKTAVR